MDDRPTQAPTPQTIFETLTAYQRSAALASAIQLDLFSAIARGEDTAERLAKACGASERGVRSLGDFLVVDGFLAKSGERYALGDVAATFLDRAKPSYMGSIAEFLHGAPLRGIFDELTASVRRGSSAAGTSGTMDPEHPAWPQFARGMAPAMAPQAELVAERLAARGARAKSVLDVAAGHGLYGIACAKRWSEARVALADWRAVLEVALENASRAGVRERVVAIEGDANTVDLGGPHDVVLVPNFLHHFDLAWNERFLRRVRAAMAPGGTLAVVEFLVSSDRLSPPPSARFSLVMLATTPGGDSFTEAEIRGVATRAGFRDVEVEELVGFGAHAIFARA
jgi:SAM-dependent methyltransferase